MAVGISKQCQAGCMSFDGGEVKHRRDCIHYPESLTKIWHDTEAELRAEIERQREILRAIEILTATGDGLDPQETIEIHIIAAEGRSDDPAAWRADPAVIEKLRAAVREV
jgi:hypothetical protein